MKRAMLLLVAAACSTSRGEPSASASEAPQVASPSTIVATMRERLADNDFHFAAAAFDDANPEDAKTVATQIAPQIVASWDAIRQTELDNAKTLGIARARGKSRDNCMRCTRFRELLDKLAPYAPELAAKWQALKPELERAETAAFDGETNDKRPRVLVRADSDEAVMVLDCALEHLRTTFPAYKFLEDYVTSGSDPNAPALVLVANKGTTTYQNTGTKERVKLLSSMQIALVGRNLDKTLAKRFAAPLVAEHGVYAPEQISGLAGPAKAEAMKVGMRQMRELNKRLCDSLKTMLAAK